MLDQDGFRLNVGIVVANGQGEVLWARRVRQGGWQFPQGGIKQGETPEAALYRELHEEVGLQPGDVELWGSTRGWLRYRLPKKMVRPSNEGKPCIGQKQKWFLLKLVAPDSAVQLDAGPSPEFDRWQWASYWYPLEQIVSFKRNVYRRMLKELSVVHSRKVADLAKSER